MRVIRELNSHLHVVIISDVSVPSRFRAFVQSVLLLAVTLPASASTWNLVYTGEQWSNVSGGIRTKSTYLDNLDITFSGKNVFGIARTEFFAYLLYNNGARFSERIVGDLQTVSNIDAPEALRLYEFWLGFDVGLNFHALVGLYDLNSEFDVTGTGSLFLNSSHGIGPDFSQSGENGPSIFPVTALAARIHWDIGDRVRLRSALFDAVPGDPNDVSETTVSLDDGVLGVVELEYGKVGGRTKLAAGYWRYSRPSRSLLPDRGAEKNHGFYALGETRLYAEDGSGQGLSGFLRYGVASELVNIFESYVGAGLVYEGLLRGRPRDLAGLAVAHAISGDAYRRASAISGPATDENETILELTYRFAVTSWLTLQPDIQYILNPGLDPARRDALSVGLRFEVSVGDDG